MSTNNAAHTPGPWNVGTDKNSIWGAGRRIAVCSDLLTPIDAERANARLIAAAPELLAALQDLDSRLRECAANPAISAADAYDSFYQEAVAGAIAKATGDEA